MFRPRGPSPGVPGVSPDCLQQHRAAFWARLESSAAILETSGAVWSILERSGAILEPSGTVWRRSEPCPEPSGAILERFGVVYRCLEPFWKALESSGAVNSVCQEGHKAGAFRGTLL